MSGESGLMLSGQGVKVSKEGKVFGRIEGTMGGTMGGGMMAVCCDDEKWAVCCDKGRGEAVSCDAGRAVCCTTDDGNLMAKCCEKTGKWRGSGPKAVCCAECFRLMGGRMSIV